MRYSVLIASVSLLLCSCVNKQYTYVETVSEPSLLGNSYSEKEKEPFVINAMNDSLAYIKAYEKFCMSQQACEMVKKKYGSEYLSIPLRFVLYDTDNNKVEPFVSTETLDSIKARIINLASNSIAYENTGDKYENSVGADSVKIKELSPSFNFKKDEFDPRGIVWIEPISAPKYTNRNGIYCYFAQIDGVAQNFRLRIQYMADDWLFIRKYQFSIDGKAYEYIPSGTVERDNDGGLIWEWSDEKISYIGDVELVEALANAKTAKIKFIGSQYHDIRTITPNEIKAIKETLDLYHAMGAKF